MTREDALEIWLPIIKMGVKSMPECSEAVDMAIKALEQEPCTDAISRFEGMTNGEVMGAVFPKAKVSRYIDEYGRPSDYLIHIDDETYFTKAWWNAPYKGGAE